MMKAGKKPGRERQPFAIQHSIFAGGIRFHFIYRSWAEVPFM